MENKTYWSEPEKQGFKWRTNQFDSNNKLVHYEEFNTLTACVEFLEKKTYTWINKIKTW